MKHTRNETYILKRRKIMKPSQFVNHSKKNFFFKLLETEKCKRIRFENPKMTTDTIEKDIDKEGKHMKINEYTD